MNTPLVDLKPEHLKIINTVLKRHLPANTKVWIFGSRVKGTARKFSDIDLAFDWSGNPFPIEISAELATDFEESDLPFPDSRMGRP